MARRVHRGRAPRVRRIGPRGGRFVYSPTVIEETYYTPYPDPLDERVALDEAGDILPTSPQSVRTALDQENANWTSLYDAVLAALAAGQIATDFSFPFTNDLFAWKTFYTLSVQSTPFGWEPMAQLDEWRKKRAVWATDLQGRIKRRLPGNLDQAPPRETGPIKPPTPGETIALVVAAGVVAAIVYFGPRFAKG